MYQDNTFVTLTFDEKYKPKDGCVRKATLQGFIKRLRARLDYYAEQYKTEPLRVRYFGVGEYGGESLRPHYHIILFGYPNCVRGRTVYTKRDQKCCDICTSIRKVWQLGHVYLGQVSFQSAAYVGGYVVKGWYKDTPFDHLTPEFTLKSNRPGIGHDVAYELASSLLASNATHVPFSVRHNGRLWPLGRYLRDKTSEFAGGLKLEKAPPDQKVHDLSESIYRDETIPALYKKMAFREALIAPRYEKARALGKKLDRKQKERPL